ncbi:MAG: FISUMP domain-containing protein [Bacteroidota bacterium]
MKGLKTASHIILCFVLLFGNIFSCEREGNITPDDSDSNTTYIVVDPTPDNENSGYDEVLATTENSATLRGTITSLDNSLTFTGHGHVWSLNTLPTIGSNSDHTDKGPISGSSTFTSSISNLIPNRTYYFRQYLKQDNGIYLYHQTTSSFVSETPGNTFIDTRDNQEYDWVAIGGQIWMAENLSYDAPGSICYEYTDFYCTNYGRLYDWSTVMDGAGQSNSDPSGVQGICPDGWHMPSQSELLTLMHHFNNNESLVYDQLIVGGESGFEGSLGGYRLHVDHFSNLDSDGYYWTSSDYGVASLRYILRLKSGTQTAFIDRESGNSFRSCRCIKD